jgi:hypothetical protein
MIGNLLVRQAAEEPKHDNLVLAPATFLEFFQSLVQIEHLHPLLAFQPVQHGIKGNTLHVSTVFIAPAFPGMVDQHPSHRICRCCEKVRPVDGSELPSCGKQLQIGLVHERSGLQRVIVTLPAHQTTGDAMEFLVNQVEESVPCFSASRIHRCEKFGHFSLGVCRHGDPSLPRNPNSDDTIEVQIMFLKVDGQWTVRS